MKPTQDDMERAARIDIGRCACSYHYLCGVHTPIAQALADAREREMEACAVEAEGFSSRISGNMPDCLIDQKYRDEAAYDCYRLAIRHIAAAIRARAAEKEAK